jgi:ADP-ribose pyrophosphatase YjhB (NUDIX family)
LDTGALHSVSVAAVITNDAGEVLMIQRRDNGHWEPPGGVLEVHESIYEGVRREVREETGLSIEPTNLTGVYKNVSRGVVALVFRATVCSGVESASAGEVAEVAWLTPSEVQGRCDEAYAIRVADALSGQPALARAHDGVNLVLP